MPHAERHRSDRISWLRAAVLGANDGLISTASLVVGVASASTEPGPVLVAAVAGLLAGALSMAAGEYVSVSSQADTEQADLARERHELATDAEAEHAELAGIYVQRGLDPALADEVARQLARRDALGAHARDELGLTHTSAARPLQAALASAASFAVGAALPLLIGMLTGVYGGIAAMVVLPFSSAQMTLMAVFILMAHALIQEGIIQGKSGSTL